MKNILTLNSISPVINNIFDATYKIDNDVTSPIGILLRSFKMHDYEIPQSVIAVARAGAGVNNIPIEEYAEKGIVVFNTPGANANAVKELVITALLLGSRKIVDAIEWTKTLKGKGEEVGKLVEKGKSNFVGAEILGKKLGVIGLGAIGGLVANAGVNLGLEVYGYDPFLSVTGALKLSRAVNVVKNLDDLIKECDYITIHVPYIPAENKGLINSGLIRKMKDGVAIINCARGEIVDNADIIKAVETKKVGRYVVDFPADELIGVENIICIPHLGASTPEAEDNCAVMASKQLIEYIENGNVINSVNYPNCEIPRTTANRILVLHKNISGILNEITGAVGREEINIESLTNKSKGNFAVTILDVNNEVSNEAINHISNVDGIIKVRVIK
ncbi:MAG: 3-phosphoglycerate dehydrogenase [Clostridia bacterium]|nr:3-phosphoglycerate dehydrogenase [Clostridia bacterium]